MEAYPLWRLLDLSLQQTQSAQQQGSNVSIARISSGLMPLRVIIIKLRRLRLVVINHLANPVVGKRPAEQAGLVAMKSKQPRHGLLSTRLMLLRPVAREKRCLEAAAPMMTGYLDTTSQAARMGRPVGLVESGAQP